MSPHRSGRKFTEPGKNRLVRCTSLENDDLGKPKSSFVKKCALMQWCWGRFLQSRLEFEVYGGEIRRLRFCLIQTIDLHLNLSSHWSVWMYLFSTFFTSSEVKILLPTPHLSLSQMLAFSHMKTELKLQNPPKRNPSPLLYAYLLHSN